MTPFSLHTIYRICWYSIGLPRVNPNIAPGEFSSNFAHERHFGQLNLRFVPTISLPILSCASVFALLTFSGWAKMRQGR